MLIKTKAPVEQVTGAQGNEIVFFRWRGAQVARNWAQPTNPNTSYQQAIRGYLTTLSRNWSNVLSPAQRVLWNDYAAGVELVNILGETYTASGFNAYVQHNMVLSMRGDSLITSPPSSAAPSPYTAAPEVVYDDGNGKLSISSIHGNTVLTGLKTLFRVETPIALGQKADIRKEHCAGTSLALSFLATVASSNALEFVLTNLRDDFSAVPPIGLSLIVTNASGQVSTPYTATVNVTTP